MFIRYILMLTAVLLCLYPVWGLVSPASYLQEILEVYPDAEEASHTQVRITAAILWISNLTLSFALLFIAKFIKQPQTYKFAKISSIALISYPFILTITEAISHSILYRHLEHPTLTIEFSAQKLFYFVFGLIILGIYQSQQEYKRAKENG
ncbi:hypothetical protein ACRN98_01870 [Shewanella oncorhynchi]|uniref:hypothetical protein n=1 Tax=Shewanella TaxID=22 RepID=UPI0021DB0769|nr:hypothetical protein [Shewanella sp. SM69]MCU8037364.1 hypothetical protein [Shewanella sp. SM69]